MKPGELFFYLKWSPLIQVLLWSNFNVVTWASEGEKEEKKPEKYIRKNLSGERTIKDRIDFLG